MVWARSAGAHAQGPKVSLGLRAAQGGDQVRNLGGQAGVVDVGGVPGQQVMHGARVCTGIGGCRACAAVVPFGGLVVGDVVHDLVQVQSAEPGGLARGDEPDNNGRALERRCAGQSCEPERFSYVIFLESRWCQLVNVPGHRDGAVRLSLAGAAVGWQRSYAVPLSSLTHQRAARALFTQDVWAPNRR